MEQRLVCRPLPAPTGAPRRRTPDGTRGIYLNRGRRGVYRAVAIGALGIG